MRLTAVHELSVNLQGSISNAVVDFSSHTVSLVALVSDQLREGQPVVGIAFNSIGRFAQSGILRQRMLPRLLEAEPSTLLHRDGRAFDPNAILRAVMSNEKPGGHGDRASAAAAIELAAWDLNAKLADEPAYEHIAKALGATPMSDGASVYAAGGYYYPQDSLQRLREEIASYTDLGFTAFKIKVGGVPLHEDLLRVEAAISMAGDGSRVAVDANARFDLKTAQAYASALATFGLNWFEEPGDPLDFDLMERLGSTYPGALATGENLFSAIDTHNLLRYAGLRADRDLLQMDPGLSYGLTEYLDILRIANTSGFARSQCVPHGGHLINLHIVTALGLGGCEAYPGVFQPFGGFAPQCKVDSGRVWPSDAPGFGLEQKAELKPYIAALMET